MKWKAEKPERGMLGMFGFNIYDTKYPSDGVELAAFWNISGRV